MRRIAGTIHPAICLALFGLLFCGSAFGASPHATIAEFRTTGTEFIEIVNRAGSAQNFDNFRVRAFEANGTTSALNYVIPSATPNINANGRIVVYMGGNPASNVYNANLTILYTGGTPNLPDALGHLRVTNNAGSTPYDYLVYTTGGAITPNPPGGAATWTGGAINISAVAAADSMSLVPSTAATGHNDQDSAGNWYRTTGGDVTIGADNALAVSAPTYTISFAYNAPATFLSPCEDFTVTVAVTNPNPSLSLLGVDVQVKLPKDFYFVSANNGGVSDNASDATANLVTFTDLTLAPGTTNLQIVVRGNCDAANQQRVVAQILAWKRVAGDADQAAIAAIQTDKINMFPVSLNIIKDNGAGATTILASRGETVTFRVQVQNTGTGKHLGNGALITDTLGAGMDFVSLQQGATTFVQEAVLANLGPNEYHIVTNGDSTKTISWYSGAINPKSDATFTMAATVSACEGLTNLAGYSYSCSGNGSPNAELCTKTSSSEASITIQLRQPNVDYTVNGVAGPLFGNIDVDWCAGSTVTIVLTNTAGSSTGAARDLRMRVSNIPAGYDVTNVTGAVLETVESDAKFPAIPAGTVQFRVTGATDTDGDTNADDIPGHATVNQTHTITYKLEQKAGNCSGPFSGTMIYQPYYADDCDVIFQNRTGVGSASTAARPSFSVTTTGSSSSVNVGAGNTISFTMVATYTNTQNSTVTFDMTTDFPSKDDFPFVNFTVNDADGGTILDSADNPNPVDPEDADKVRWTVTLVTTPGSPTATVTKTLVLNAPTITCAAGTTYSTVTTVPTVGVDCRGCDIDGDTDSATFHVNNADNENAISTQSRSVDYSYNHPSTHPTGSANINSNTVETNGASAVEGCTLVRVNSSWVFSATAPATWKDVVGTSDIEFREDLTATTGRGLNYSVPAGGGTIKSRVNLQVTYRVGATTTDVTASIPATDVTQDANGALRVNLESLDAIVGLPKPSAQGEATVSMTLYAGPTATSGLGWSIVTVPVAGGEDCTTNTPQNYDMAANISKSDLNLTVSHAILAPASASQIDKCQAFDIRFTVANGTPWQPYDTQFEINLDPDGDGTLDYEYTSGSAALAGWQVVTGTDNINKLTGTTEPQRTGNVLRWYFGDLDHGQPPGTVTIEVSKVCSTDSQLRGTIRFNRNCDNVTPDASGSPGSQSNSSTFSPTILRSGVLSTRLTPETYFAVDAYPRFEYNVINSGNGNLYNTWITLRLDSNANTGDGFQSSLVYLLNSAKLDGVAFAPESVTEDGPGKPREVKWRIPVISPGDLRKLTFDLRLEGCTDLEVRVDSRWGCDSAQADPHTDEPSLAAACGVAASSVSVVAQPSSDIVVTEHTIDPEVIPNCAEPILVSAKLENLGVTEVYNVRYYESVVPPGMEFVPGSLYYSYNGGAYTAFPGGGNPSSTTTKANGDLESLTVNLTDPDNSWPGGNGETDSIITSTDGHEADGDGFRHHVLKQGDSVAIRYQLRVRQPGGDACVALNRLTTASEAEKVFRSAATFDTPCAHTNPGPPASAGTFNLINIVVGEPDLELTLLETENVTKSQTYGSGPIYAEQNDELRFRFKMQNVGNWRANGATYQYTLPVGTSFVSLTKVPTSNPAAMILRQDGGDMTLYHVDRDGNAGTTTDNYMDGLSVPSVDYTSFLPAPSSPSTPNPPQDETITFDLVVRVDQCGGSFTTNFKTHWGCCDTAMLAEHEIDVELIAQPPQPTVSVAQVGTFTTCGGQLKVTITNPDTSVGKFFTLYDMDLRETLPAGYVYDSSVAPTVTFSGWAGRTGLEWQVAERTPKQLVGALQWGSTAVGGDIAPARAIVGPGETIEVSFWLKADATWMDPNTNSTVASPPPDRNDNDPTNPDRNVPAFNNTVTFNSYNSCGTALGLLTRQVSVNPLEPDLDVTMVADKVLVSVGETVTWTITVVNNGSTAAMNPALTIDIGSLGGTNIGGYSSANVTQNPPAGYTAGDDTVSWGAADIGTLNPSASYVIRIQGVVGPRGTGDGDLSIRATLTGECADASGALTGLYYSRDFTHHYVAGVAIDKVFESVNAPGAIGTADTAATSSIGNVVTYRLVADFLSPGTFANVVVLDDLDPADSGRMSYVGMTVDVDTGTTPAPVYDGGTETLTIRPNNGTFTGPAVFEYLVTTRVENVAKNQGDPPAGTATAITNAMHLDFDFGGASYAHGTYPAILSEADTVLTVVEPYVTNGNFTASANPACNSTVVADTDIDYTVTMQNTGSSPAYEVSLLHTVDVGKRDTPVSLVVVAVDAGAGNPRTLTNAVDYTISQDNSTTSNVQIDLLTTASAAIQPSETITFTYRLRVDSGVGANEDILDRIRLRQYTSLPGDGAVTAENGEERISGYNLAAPNYSVNQRSCRHRTQNLPSAKTVQAANTPNTGELQGAANLGNTNSAVTIGELLTYRIKTTVFEGTTAYDLRITDTIPDGLTVTGLSYVIGANPAITPAIPGEQADGTTDLNVLIEQTLGAGDNDILAPNGGADLDIVLTITTRVDAALSSAHAAANFPNSGSQNDFTLDQGVIGTVDAGDRFANRAVVRWNRVNGGSGRTRTSNWVETTVKEPTLSFTKVSDDADAQVDQSQFVTYTLTATNSGTASAWNTTIVDQIPDQLKASFTLVSILNDGNALSETGPDDYDISDPTTTGTLTITLKDTAAAAIQPSTSLVITYRVQVPATIGAGHQGATALINVANLTSYYSLNDTDDADPGNPRRQYANIGPRYVALTTAVPAIAKAANPVTGSSVDSDDVALRDITYTLTVPSAAITSTMYDVEVTDTLPDGLEILDPQVGALGAGDIQVTGGFAPVTITATTVGSGTRVRQVTVNAARIDPGTTMVITIKARVRSTFDNTFAINAGHIFENIASATWKDDTLTAVYGIESNRVDHVYKAEGILLEPDHTENGVPGTTKLYRHTLRNFHDAAEDITITYPASTQGWEWQLFRGDGNGTIVGSYLPSGSVINVPGTSAPGTNFTELIMRANIPQNAPPYSTDILTVTATDTTGLTDTVTDVTIIQAQRVEIRKDISLDDISYDTNLDVKPGNEVYQRLTFRNEGTESVKAVMVFDVIPANSRFVHGSATNTPGVLDLSHSVDGGSTWIPGAPASAVISDMVTNLRWTYNGTGGLLAPGASGQVKFRIRIK